MARDFTLKIYRQLLQSAMDAGYQTVSFEDYQAGKSVAEKVLILRHDVDRLPGQSLQMAELENELGAKGTYYFRVARESFNPAIIQKIAALGHEIGYHYEDVALEKGNLEKAFDEFKIHLDEFRKYYPVKTICMHGSPLSKWDNRLLWTRHEYRNLGITGEPYVDVDFNKVFYISDTGRGWNRKSVSVRDKVETSFRFRFHSTKDLIFHFRGDKLPKHIMLTIHPQRWSDQLVPWFSELLFQNVKNMAKGWLAHKSNSSLSA